MKYRCGLCNEEMSNLGYGIGLSNEVTEVTLSCSGCERQRFVLEQVFDLAEKSWLGLSKQRIEEMKEHWFPERKRT